MPRSIHFGVFVLGTGNHTAGWRYPGADQTFLDITVLQRMAAIAERGLFDFLFLGDGLAANLPPLFAAAILLLTPLAFLLSTARNCRQISDVLALVLGIALFPLVSMLHTGVDILISGVTAGTIAYGVHWWRERERA